MERFVEPALSGQEANVVPAHSSNKILRGKCNRVVDGDSLYIAGLATQIRLWGVDAPERDEKGYSDARQSLNYLAYGKVLRCEQQDIDQYKRIVARCFIADSNLELNREQLLRGVAREYCYFSKNYYGHCR